MAYTGSQAELDTAAKDTLAHTEDVEARLTDLSGIRSQLSLSLRSAHAGNALNQQLGRAHDNGKALAATLNEIVDDLKNLGAAVSAQDQEGLDEINRAFGATDAVDSKLDSTTWS